MKFIIVLLSSIILSGFAFAQTSSEASFPGGETALYMRIHEGFKTPVEAIKKGEYGQVIIQFTVNEDGSISKAKILEGVSKSLDNEALRVIQSLPNWKAATKDGSPISSIVKIAIECGVPLPPKKITAADFELVNDLDDIENSFKSFYFFINNTESGVPELFSLKLEEMQAYLHALHGFRHQEDAESLKLNYQSTRENGYHDFYNLRKIGQKDWSKVFFDYYINKDSSMVKQYLEQNHKGYFISFFVNEQKQLRFLSMSKRKTYMDFKTFVMKELESKEHSNNATLVLNSPFKSSKNDKIAFRENEKWGVKSISSQEVVVPAIYDSLFKLSNGYRIVYNDDGYNLMDTSYNLFYPEAKQHIRNHFLKGVYHYEYSDDGTNYTKVGVESKREGRSFYKWNKLYDEECKANFKVKEDYDSPGTFNLTSQEGEIKHTFTNVKKVSVFGSFFFVEAYDSNYVYTPQGEILFRTDKPCKIKKPGYLTVFDHQTKLFGYYDPYNKFYIEPQYDYIAPLSRGELFVVRHAGQIGYLDAKGNRYF
ncbi:MAG: energy transducer TonB [Flavobacteriales bacterium]|nr:energy transducer TonB [Flavobacteriales bacterium]